MQSPTAEVKEIIVNLLKANPNVEFTNPEIKGVIAEKATQQVTEGVISGALYTLSKEEQSGVVNISRGTYMYNPQISEESEDLTITLQRGVKESAEKLRSVVKNLDPLQLEPKDLPILGKMKKLIEDLEAFDKELYETYNDKFTSQVNH